MAEEASNTVAQLGYFSEKIRLFRVHKVAGLSANFVVISHYTAGKPAPPDFI